MARRLSGLAAALVATVTVASCIDLAASSRATAAPAGASVSSMTDPRGGSSSERRFTAYLTGYSFWDNTPPGSAEISKPVIHRKAGGTGTYADPVTIAVGHRIEGGRQTLDFAPGTRFYIERLQKYAIVEDVCGDGNRPQDGPCHTGHRGHPWLDIYIGGGKVSVGSTQTCMNRITALQNVVINPRPDYPVNPGEIASTCQMF